tara:strand:- start:1562 stop:2326 length:765 start_codon:yes stop_codon:yes gene_type:complete
MNGLIIYIFGFILSRGIISKVNNQNGYENLLNQRKYVALLENNLNKKSNNKNIKYTKAYIPAPIFFSRDVQSKKFPPLNNLYINFPYFEVPVINLKKSYEIVDNTMREKINIIKKLFNRNLFNKNPFRKKNINALLEQFCPKTKVYLHIERITPIIPIYHIGISFKSFYTTIRYDVGQVNKINLLRFLPFSIKQESHKLFWGYTDKSIKEIINYEQTLTNKYILGINDCRHYTRNLAIWTTNKSTPIWKITDLL